MKEIMDGYSIGSNVICLLSLFAGLAVIYKLTRRPRGLMRGNSATNGPHSMKRFMDQVVRVRVRRGWGVGGGGPLPSPRMCRNCR